MSEKPMKSFASLLMDYLNWLYSFFAQSFQILIKYEYNNTKGTKVIMPSKQMSIKNDHRIMASSSQLTVWHDLINIDQSYIKS